MIHLKTVLLLSLFALIFGNTFGQAADIYLTINKIEGTNGQLVIGIFDNSTDFKEKANPFKAAKLEVTDSTVFYTFSDIPAGKYAMAVFHDENSDGKVNVKSMKIPIEGVGISGKKTGKLRPPKFKEMAFRLINDTTIIISLRYPGKP